jgi:hypothetical protein
MANDDLTFNIATWPSIPFRLAMHTPTSDSLRTSKMLMRRPRYVGPRSGGTVRGLTPDKSGDLNGSTQHSGRTNSALKTKAKIAG